MLSEPLPCPISGPLGKVTLLEDVTDGLPYDTIRCRDLHWIARRWSAMPLREGEKLPRWDCFDVKAFAAVLSRLCVLHIEDRQVDTLEFAVYGSHPTNYVGLGKPLRLSDMKGDAQTYENYVDIRDRAIRAIRNETPQYARKTLAWNGRADIEYEALMLPFAPDGSPVQRLLQPISAWTQDGSLWPTEIDSSI